MDDVQPLPTNRSLALYKNIIIARRGEEEISAAPKELKQLDTLGLVRPKNWPSVMAWPPVTVREAMRKGRITDENISRFQTYYDKYADKTVERAEKLRKHLDRDESFNEDRYRKRLFMKKRQFDSDPTGLHQHIAWALLLDPHEEFLGNYAKTVRSWGRTTMTTLDGGSATVTEDGVRLRKISEQSIRLMFEEAKARGWETIETKGEPKYIQAVMAMSKQYNIRVEATEFRFLLDFTGRKIESNLPITKDTDALKELASLREELATSMDPGQQRKPEQMAEPSVDTEIPMG